MNCTYCTFPAKTTTKASVCTLVLTPELAKETQLQNDRLNSIQLGS